MTFLCPALAHAECPFPHGNCAAVCALAVEPTPEGEDND